MAVMARERQLVIPGSACAVPTGARLAGKAIVYAS